MSSRAARIASAAFTTVLMGAPATAILHVTANAAEDCRTEPGDKTPDGQHWYYRIERSSGRQCWYLREIGERPSQAEPAQRSEKAVEPKPEAPAVQRSVADARAELPWPQTRIEQNTTSIPQRPQAAPADAANTASAQRPNVLESTPRGSAIGSQWPNPGVNPTVSPPPPPATSNMLADAQLDQTTTPTQAATSPVPDAVPAKPTGSLPRLLMVVAGALALAGLLASAILRLGRVRRRARSIDRERRRVVWEAADGARPRPAPSRQAPPRQAQPRQAQPRQPQPQPRKSASRQSPPPSAPAWVDPEYARRPGFTPGRNEPSNHNERLDKISEFLDRMSRQPSHY